MLPYVKPPYSFQMTESPSFFLPLPCIMPWKSVSNLALMDNHNKRHAGSAINLKSNLKHDDRKRYFKPASKSDFHRKRQKKDMGQLKSTINPGDLNMLTLPSTEEFCLLHFKKTKNNTYCTISRLFGRQKTLWSISGGIVNSGSKTNGRRKTRFTQRMVFKYTLEKLLGLGFKYLVIHCSSPALSKRYIFKNFYKRFKIVLLKDLTPYAHNGCRASNIRRV
jgi:small subunit ribosomal protein S11